MRRFLTPLGRTEGDANRYIKVRVTFSSARVTFSSARLSPPLMPRLRRERGHLLLITGCPCTRCGGSGLLPALWRTWKTSTMSKCRRRISPAAWARAAREVKQNYDITARKAQKCRAFRAPSREFSFFSHFCLARGRRLKGGATARHLLRDRKNLVEFTSGLARVTYRSSIARILRNKCNKSGCCAVAPR